MLKVISAAIAFASIAGVATAARAASCVPPRGFVETEPPVVAPADQLVAHTEDIDISRPLATVLEVVNGKSLENTIHSPNSLPGVSGTYPLTKGDFGEPGTRRITCLTDGSALEEQVLERHQTQDAYHFRYVVWNFTTAQARPIVYGVGDFHFSAAGLDRTHVHWTYAFQLNRGRFPGFLGSLGDFLFRVSFLDRQYAEMMRGTLNGYKSDAERGSGS